MEREDYQASVGDRNRINAEAPPVHLLGALFLSPWIPAELRPEPGQAEALNHLLHLPSHLAAAQVIQLSGRKYQASLLRNVGNKGYADIRSLPIRIAEKVHNPTK